MACEAERRPLGVFECQLCALTAPYSYVGQKPPNTQSVVLLEESYVMKDPFTWNKDGFLILGSRCSVCSQLVCVGPGTFQSFLEHLCARPVLGTCFTSEAFQSCPQPGNEECSLFYSKRFCLPCVQENIEAFPQQIRQDLEKRKLPSKRPASLPASRT